MFKPALGWVVLIVFAAVMVVGVTSSIMESRKQPYYLACANRHGEELLLRTEKKPEIKYGLVFLDKELFTVPEQGMTCRVISVEEAEQEKRNKPVDNVI